MGRVNEQRLPLWHGRALALLGILVVALNLRASTNLLSSIYPFIRETFDVPPLVVGIIGAIAPFAFATAAFFAPRIGRGIGLEQSLLLAIGLIVSGHILRTIAPNYSFLMVGAILSLFGTGMGNVLLPPAVKKYFPDRIGLMTALYMTLMSVSATVPALIGVPLSESVGWRTSIAVWVFTSLAAVIPWVIELRNARRHPDGVNTADLIADPTQSHVAVWRSPTAWAIMLVLAVSSINGYVAYAWLAIMMPDVAGLDVSGSAMMLALYGITGLPPALIIPILASRMKRADRLVHLGTALFIAGWLGFLLSPTNGTWVWGTILGFGGLLFPLALVLINLRSRTTATSMTVSGFAQVGAYLFAGFGPIIVGVLHQIQGDWHGVLIFLIIVTIPAFVGGIVLGRNRIIDDELSQRRLAPTKGSS
jgi:CP family cyanate transporter-like MFS transporter